MICPFDHFTLIFFFIKNILRVYNLSEWRILNILRIHQFLHLL